MRQVVAFGLAALIGACGAPTGRQFSTTLVHTSLDNPAGDYPLGVVLGDETNLVTAIESAEEAATDPGPLSVKVDPSVPNAIIAVWLGGLCDGNATLSFQRSGSGYALRLDTHEKVGGGCPAAGIGRAVRIKLSAPVQPGDILLSGEG
ncbi:MAG: hypothetical protein QOI92_171 [Chloroflexota bacterium]|jgi:hypothetical protein|nr:hypothetical protein [Chloroflexota bacterium]